MRQRLLTLAALASTLGAGLVIFANWDTGQVVRVKSGGLDFVDRDSCSVSACGANLCVQADNVLADAGSGCRTRLFTCEMRVGQRARNWASDAGVTLSSPKLYQTLRVPGLRCPAVDGGFNFTIPLDDAGMPQFASLTAATPSCVRSPLDGGQCVCNGVLLDGGAKYTGPGNVCRKGGTGNCEAINCKVLFGDDPDTDL